MGLSLAGLQRSNTVRVMKWGAIGTKKGRPKSPFFIFVEDWCQANEVSIIAPPTNPIIQAHKHECHLEPYQAHNRWGISLYSNDGFRP